MAKKFTRITKEEFQRLTETDFGVNFNKDGTWSVTDQEKLAQHQEMIGANDTCIQCRFYKAGSTRQLAKGYKPAFFVNYANKKCIDCTEKARVSRLQARRQKKIDAGLNPDGRAPRRTKAQIQSTQPPPLALPAEIMEALDSIKELRLTIDELTTNNERLDTRVIQLAEENKLLRKQNTEMQEELADLKKRAIRIENRVNDKHERLDELAAESESKAKELQDMIYEFKNSYQTKSSIQAVIKAELEEIRIRLLDEVNSTVVPVQEQVQVCAENLDQLQELVESTIDSVATAPASPQPPDEELSQINSSPTSADEFPVDFDAADRKQAKAEWDNFEEVRARYKQACKEAEDRGEPKPAVEQFFRARQQLPRPTFW